MVAQVAAQTANGSLRGTVRDEQGGVLPGVTVTARSPQALTPGVAVTDATGEFRIPNLPPGTYTLTAELTGFAVFNLEGILLRAGANFQVQDMALKLGSLQESVTVSGASPMVEVSTSTTSMNIDAQFQKALPLTEGSFWTDFLQMTPGVLSRPHNDGSGRQNYYAQGVEHREHVTLMDGMMAANYWDMNVNRTGLSGEAIADTNVKLGGVDASAPMGYGLVINMAAKSGGNTFSGSAAYTGQPFAWNDDNSIEREGISGTAGTRRVRQADFSFGGPIMQDRTWFFGAYRTALIDSTVDRSPLDIQAFQAFRPDVNPDDLLNELYSQQPFVKVTTKLASNHELAGVIQYDRMRQKSVRSNDSERITRTDVGGGMYGVSLQSVWSSSVTTKFAVNYNDKRGNDRRQLRTGIAGARADVRHSPHSRSKHGGFSHGLGGAAQWGRIRHGRPGEIQLLHDPRRSHLVQAGVGWNPRVPDRLPVDAPEPVRGRQHRAQRRVHLRGAAPDRSEQPRIRRSSRSREPTERVR